MQGYGVICTAAAFSVDLTIAHLFFSSVYLFSLMRGEKVVLSQDFAFLSRKNVLHGENVNGYPLTGCDAFFLLFLFVPFLCLLPLLLYLSSW